MRANSDRLWERADKILDKKANGHALPILKALARRNHHGGQTTLSNLFCDSADPRERRIGLTLLRRLARSGDDWSLYNLAIHYRNQCDMIGYRYWLTRAAKLKGDPYHGRELRFFEIRFPHGVMRSFGRIRPWLKRDDWRC